MKLDATTAQSQLLAASLLSTAPAAQTPEPAAPEPQAQPARTGQTIGAATVVRSGALLASRAIAPTDLAAQAAAMTRRFGQELAAAFAGAGIAGDAPVTLRQSPDGSIEVVGSHPEALKIEQLFADRPDLAARYGTVAQTQAKAARASAFEDRWVSNQETDPGQKFRAKAEILPDSSRLTRAAHQPLGEMQYHQGDLAPAASATGSFTPV